MKKRIAIIASGIIVSLILFSMFSYIDVRFAGTGELLRRCFSELTPCSNEEFYSGVQNSIARASYIYFPLNIIFVSLFVGFFERNKTQLIDVFISVLPLIILNLLTSSFDTNGLILTAFYLFVTVFMTYVIQKSFQHFQPK
jgi:hypothetical protein